MRILGALLLILTVPVWAAAPAMTETAMSLSHEGAKAGSTLTAALVLKHHPEWHTYWQNPGGTGKPTKITWELPSGVTAGPIEWPVPEIYQLDDQFSYVYHGEVALLVPLTIGANAPPGTTTLKAKVTWLECKTDGACVPQVKSFELPLTIGDEKLSASAEPISQWKKLIPNPGTDIELVAHWDGPAASDIRPFIVTVNKEGAWDFYAFAMEGLEIGAKTEKLPAIDAKVAFRKFAEKYEGEWPKRVDGLAVLGGPKKPERAVVVSLNIADADASAAPIAAVTLPMAEQGPSLGFMLLMAFLGGLILNIMPCVLPVIALKILGFVRQSKEDPRRVRTLGLVYALGVLASFVALALLVIGVKQAGRAASWGMQFQNPQFLVFITTLVTLVALNLFGVFEVAIGGKTMSAAGELASREGNSGAFFNGVLATILATPCTAPFLGVALGFAFAQPASIILLTFLTVGLGLAAPYVALCWFPAWLKKLPKPGAWMERFKVAMGFPMLGTAIWLYSLAAPNFGKAGALYLGLFLALVALGAWIFGEFVQRGSMRRGLSGAISIGIIAVAFGWILERELNWRNPVRESAGGEIANSATGVQWKRWSADAVQAARAEGHPVLVDFTADWCFTCKVNKRTSIEIPAVREKLKEINAVAFKGDFTMEDPVIAAELARYKRAGVPLVLVFPPDPKEAPLVLPEFLRPNIVLEALEKAAAGRPVTAAK